MCCSFFSACFLTLHCFLFCSPVFVFSFFLPFLSSLFIHPSFLCFFVFSFLSFIFLSSLSLLSSSPFLYLFPSIFIPLLFPFFTLFVTLFSSLAFPFFPPMVGLPWPAVKCPPSLSLLLPNRKQGEEGMKNLQAEIKTGRLLTTYTKRQNRVDLMKIYLLPIKKYLGREKQGPKKIKTTAFPFQGQPSSFIPNSSTSPTLSGHWGIWVTLSPQLHLSAAASSSRFLFALTWTLCGQHLLQEIAKYPSVVSSTGCSADTCSGVALHSL